MSTRNRSSYANQKSRRAGGGGAVRQAGVILSMGALSFVLGFFVLSRFVPAGRGPDSPMGQPSGNNAGGGRAIAAAPAPQERQDPPAPRERRDPPATHPAAPPAGAPGPTIDPAPGIDPKEEGRTQPPASIDASSDDKKSADVEKSDSDENKSENQDQTGSRQTAGVRSVADGGGRSEAAPPRRRRRRRTQPAPDTAVVQKPADNNVTQRAASLDDADAVGGDKSDKTGKSGQDDGNNEN